MKCMEYQKQLSYVTQRRDVGGLLDLAKKSEADFVAVPQDFPQITSGSLVFQDRFWRVYGNP